jgi:hypothetical protein
MCVSMYVCMHACVYACMHVFVYACMHVCCAVVYVCMHVCMSCRACGYACMHVAFSLNAWLNRWSSKQGNLVRHYGKFVFGMLRWVCSVCVVGYVWFVLCVFLICMMQPVLSLSRVNALVLFVTTLQARGKNWRGSKTGEEAK